MIKNQLQYKVSSAQLAKFENAIADMATREAPEGTHPLMWKAQLDGLKSQADTIRRDLRTYEYLTSGLVQDIEVGSLQELPLGLIKARISKGLTQSDLADLCGVKQQQIQRWEDDGYYKAKFEQLIKVAKALDVSVTENIAFEKEAKGNVSTLKKVGIDLDFLKRRLCPSAQDTADALLKSAEYLKRIWGIVLRENGDLDVDNMFADGAQLARFKLPKNADNLRVRAYAQYAFRVAEIVSSCSDADVKRVSRNWPDVREALIDRGGLNLESLFLGSRRPGHTA